MSLRFSTYDFEGEARRAVHALEATGVPASDIRLLTGRPVHDVRREPVGGFAGPVAPEAPVGKYAGRARLRRQAAGGWAGNPDRERQGTFGDADLGVHAVYERGSRRSLISTDREIRRLLRGAALPQAAVEELVDELHRGHTVVLTDTR
jgi:hypothetical protein